ncbi:MAG TPA: luciferase family protein [Polyangiaceae bacterium]|nr:luciferase family protein [Polyangiaceae bacterium]
MQTLAERLVEDVREWPHLHERKEDYGAVGWSLAKGTIGHVHVGSGVVDVLFTRAIRDQLLREHLAEQHRYQPNSGWVTWRLKTGRDFDRARWLLRLSYLRRLSRPTQNEVAGAAFRRVKAEVSGLKLSDELRALVEHDVPRAADSHPPMGARIRSRSP